MALIPVTTQDISQTKTMAPIPVIITEQTLEVMAKAIQTTIIMQISMEGTMN